MKKRTKVLVYSKSTGCSIDSVIGRRQGRSSQPKKIPYVAYIRRVGMGKEGKEEYTLTYTKGGNGGDYYLRSDFKLFYDEDMFSDKDFLL